MIRLCDFPPCMFAFILAIPALAKAIANVEGNRGAHTKSTSPFDPFEQLRLRATPRPSEPICCLIPSTSEPLPTTAEFLSFEEWKSKQRELQAQAQATNQTPSPEMPIPDTPSISSGVSLGDTDQPPPPLTETTPGLSPHFRVPLTDRFNYASLDCSARVHTSHSTARSPSAILSSKKDRYMLSPCSADPKFVVVELCDDIRIDTVQLANFEFFSGVFRDFRVSVAQTYTSDGQGWIEAGTYRAKNIRGVQSFHPLVELRPFYRYIRIDFLTHYGTEFYCPISLLRVYGLTQMEEWKWEVWQGASENNGRAKLHSDVEDTELVNDQTPPERYLAANQPERTDPKATVYVETTPAEVEVDNVRTTPERYVTWDKESQRLHAEVEMPSTFTLTSLEASVAVIPSPSDGSVTSETIASPSIFPSDEAIPSLNDTREIRTDTSSFPLSLPTSANTSILIVPNASLPTGSSASSASSVQIVVPLPSPSPIPSGESIYRTIMNRLAMLETNTTLYQKYVEEQTLQVREALRRLEEDVGRLEGISKAQQHIFSKTLHDLESRRRQMEEERWELLAKVNHLADEVILEKRLGVAQLCLLLTVLVFMALTRGSRTDAVSLLDGTMHRLNNLSGRSRWSSIDWTQRRWTSRSPTPTPMDPPIVNGGSKKDSHSVAISSSRGDVHTFPAPLPTTPSARSQTPRSQLRRPTTPRHHDISRLGSADRPIGRLRRSNSQTTSANAPLSAKRFARTAHLHEVRLSIRRRAKVSGSDEAPSEDERGPDPTDGSPKPKNTSTGYPSSAHMLPATSTWAGMASGREGSEAESWVDTELGSDPGADYDEAESDGQEVEIKTEHAESSPILDPPPLNFRRHLESHTPSSPASVSD